MTGLVYATAATALAIVAVFAGYLISHLKSKVARLEHAQSELVRRGNLSNEKSRQYQNTLSGVLASLPIPSAIIDVRDRSIVAESECLTKQLQSMSTARISEPAFSTCFFSEDRLKTSPKYN